MIQHTHRTMYSTYTRIFSTHTNIRSITSSQTHSTTVSTIFIIVTTRSQSLFNGHGNHLQTVSTTSRNVVIVVVTQSQTVLTISCTIWTIVLINKKTTSTILSQIKIWSPPHYRSSMLHP